MIEDAGASVVAGRRYKNIRSKVTAPTLSMPTTSRILMTTDTILMIMRSMHPRPGKSNTCKKYIKINVSQCCTIAEKEYVFLLD